MIRSVTAACLSSAELPENWTDTRETLLEGMVFQLKYLGVTMVEQPKGEELSAAAVKRIVATVREKTHTLMLLQQAKTHTHTHKSWCCLNTKYSEFLVNAALFQKMSFCQAPIISFPHHQLHHLKTTDIQEFPLALDLTDTSVKSGWLAAYFSPPTPRPRLTFRRRMQLVWTVLPLYKGSASFIVVEKA